MSQEIDLLGDNGVVKKIISEGTGSETPTDGCRVSLHYIGKLTDGKIFDSSVEKKEPFEFVLGKASVIKAFDTCVASMKKGEKCIVTCEPKYAYGTAGSPPNIPPNATLIFELELLDWKGEDLSSESDGGIERFIITKSIRKKTPNEGSLVKIHLTGKFEGEIFEDRDIEFNLGEGLDVGVVEGIEVALLKISVQETSRLILKPKYAFGNKGNPKLNIPPNATVEYIVTLKECEKAIEEWKLDAKESLEQAKLFKEKGSNYLKQGKYRLAIKMYQKSMKYLSSYDNEETKQVKLANHLNMTLCYQKLEEYFEAKSACVSALELDPKNVKALYRQGQCFASINDFENALDCFQMVYEIDPQNKAAINQIAICQRKKKELHNKEKQIYANMFSKFAAVDKQYVVKTSKPQKDDTCREEETDVLSSCGEWTEEDAYREADKAFERDDNIIMLE